MQTTGEAAPGGGYVSKPVGFETSAVDCWENDKWPGVYREGNWIIIIHFLELKFFKF